MGITILSGAVLMMAGKYVSEDFISGAAIRANEPYPVDFYISGAEAELNTLTRYDWSGNWAGLQANHKHIVSQTVGAMAAVGLIIYDMSVYSSRVEAEDMINVLRDKWLRNMSVLRDEKAREVVQTAA